MVAFGAVRYKPEGERLVRWTDSKNQMKIVSALPRYEHVKQVILEHIARGAHGETRLLPSENELVKLLGVSRMTVNRALRELADTGLVTRVPGVGTFSADRKSELSAIDVRDIAEEIRQRGGVYDCRIEKVAAERATSELADDLGLKRGDRVFHSVIIHREDGIPIQVEDRFVNPEGAPNYLTADFTRQTPHVYLSQASPLTDAEHLIEAVIPGATDRKRLRIGPGEACLLVRRRTWSGRICCSCATLLHPSSRYRITSRFRTTRASHASLA